MVAARLAGVSTPGRTGGATITISISCAIPLEVADQIMSGDALETSLTLCKLAGFEWATVRAILQIRPNKARLSSERLVALCDDYANLSTANAATVLQVGKIAITRRCRTSRLFEPARLRHPSFRHCPRRRAIQ